MKIKTNLTMEDTAENSKVTSLTTLSAALTFENLPDNKKEEALLHWLSTQSPAKQQDFLAKAKQLVNNGVTENAGYYHYVIIHSSLTETFLSQRFINVLNGRLEDQIGGDQVKAAFVNYSNIYVVALDINSHEIIASLNAQQPMMSEGICFKLAVNGVTKTEHDPMYLDCLHELLDNVAETVYHICDQQYCMRLLEPFRPMRKSQNSRSYDFDIFVNGQKRHFLYFAQV
jgi:hypothetical protein